ncbi:GDYXXLXY domain-containing protein [Piscibacillus sp. B03]|uniref:GDYXXLXY domain-containing protein n=1 Tax=Piscibacillus sp. B03 TaxID=3457430 RepID=UPI003FCD722E
MKKLLVMVKRRLFIIVIVLQLLFLAVMAGLNYVVEEFGDVIYLETEPYDPRDVFYGDYVNLNYTVENIHPSYWFGSEKVKRNKVINVLLKPDERGLYVVKAASDKSLEPQGKEVVIRARYLYKDHQNVRHVTYGINRYYIEEGTGENFNTINENMVVTIALSPWGQKKILKVEKMD